MHSSSERDFTGLDTFPAVIHHVAEAFSIEVETTLSGGSVLHQGRPLHTSFTVQTLTVFGTPPVNKPSVWRVWVTLEASGEHQGEEKGFKKDFPSTTLQL